MPRWTREVAVVGLVASAVMFTNLGGPRLWDRDEPRNAGCALEMLVRGDWVTPVFNGELRSHKPVLLYWLTMTAYAVFGVSEFAARFWSAALAVGSSLCTYAMGRRLFGGDSGAWAGVALATSLMFCVAGRAATPDSLLVFLSTLSITVYVYGTWGFGEDAKPARPELFPQWPVAVLMYAAMGLAILAKGPVGLVLPTAVIGMFLLLARLPQGDVMLGRLRVPLVVRAFHPLHFLRVCWSMRPITCLAVCLAVAGPWYLWVGYRTDGQFLRGFFLEHNLGRAMQPMEGHAGGLWFYPAALSVGFFPWSVLFLPMWLDGLRRSRREEPLRHGYRLVACWIGVYVLAFSAAQTKLPSYVTPCYPALALAAGAFMMHWKRDTLLVSRSVLRLALGVLAMVGCVLLVVLPAVAHRWLPGDEWLAAISLIPAVCGGVCWWMVHRERQARGALVFGVSAAMLAVVSFGLVASRVSQRQQLDEILAHIDNRRDEVRVAAFGLLEPSWVYYGRRTVEEVAANGLPESMGRWTQDSSGWQPKQGVDISDIAAADDEWVIITSESHIERLRDMLPDRFQVLHEVPYFLKDERLYLLGVARGYRVAETPGEENR